MRLSLQYLKSCIVASVILFATVSSAASAATPQEPNAVFSYGITSGLTENLSLKDYKIIAQLFDLKKMKKISSASIDLEVEKLMHVGNAYDENRAVQYSPTTDSIIFKAETLTEGPHSDEKPCAGMYMASMKEAKPTLIFSDPTCSTHAWIVDPTKSVMYLERKEKIGFQIIAVDLKADAKPRIIASWNKKDMYLKKFAFLQDRTIAAISVDISGMMPTRTDTLFLINPDKRSIEERTLKYPEDEEDEWGLPLNTPNLSPDGQKYAYGFKLADMKTTKVSSIAIKRFEPNSYHTFWSGDGRYIATGVKKEGIDYTENSDVMLYDLRTGKAKKAFSINHSSHVVQWAPSTQYILLHKSVNNRIEKEQLLIYDTKTRKQSRIFSVQTADHIGAEWVTLPQSNE